MMEMFSTITRQFEADYSNALLTYLTSGRESALQEAYEMGRKALQEGRTILDVSRFHAEALLAALSSFPADAHKKAITDAAAFFSEFLSSFDMTSRGFLETVSALKTEIAERKSAEEALEQSGKYYKSLIENALDVVTILDAGGNVVYTSPSGERVLGYSDSELAGRNVFEFIHPEDVDLVLEIFASGRTVPRKTAKAEYRFKHKNGDWLKMESIGKNLLEDPFVKGIIVNSRDITERRNLEEIRRKYEFIANASQELMLLVNSQYVIEAVNEASCTALSRGRHEILGKHMNDVLDQEDFRSVVDERVKGCMSGLRTKGEGWFELPGSGRKYLEIDCYPYWNIPSIVTHAIVIIRDATERKRSEDKIRESQRQRAEVLRRYAQLTQQAQEDERRRIARELHDEIGQRLTALNLRLDDIEELVTAGKPVSTRRLRSAKLEVSNMFAEIRRISHNLRPSALDHFGLITALLYLAKEYKKLNAIRVDFETNIPSRRRYSPEVETALYRVAQEALSNCVKYARVRQAALKISETDGKLALNVSDDGRGFNLTEYRNRTDAEQHFGLINMRERIELCGGTFSLESSIGGGTKISAIVPLGDQNEK